MPSFAGARAWIKDKFQPLTTGTLTRRLILRTAAIMAALAIALGVATSVAMQRVMLRNVDNSLAISQATFWRDPVILPGGHTVNGLSETGLEVVIVDGVLQRAQMHSHGADVELNLTMVMQLRTVPANGLPVTIDIPGFGEWRLSHQARIRMSAGSIPVAMEYIVGVPTRGLYTFTNDVIFIEAVLTLIAVGVTAIVVNVVVRNSLRPLSQMAETAERVAAMNLERGETRIVERVALDSNAPSEVGQVGLALNTMLDNVDDALAARQESETKVRQFVADASHELRNPLASIRGYAELTRRGRDELPPDTGFALSRIQSESERMSKLIDDLLLLARLDAGRDPNFEAVDVAELLVNAVSDAQAAGQDHEWSVTAPEEPVLVRADLGQLHQVLANLLSNARKHTPAGSAITARLRVSATAYGIDNGDTKNHAPKIPAGGAGTSVSGHSRLAVLTVTDDGPGIPADVIPTIFERFTRADTARSHSAEASTGLGLSIVAAVIAAHGGRVWAESKPGHTVFTVILPVMD